ncbi:Bifunctional cytochrome P450/NADPH--P450 reductase [Brevundimonas sp. NIBR10]|uniref:bifunctional cytochrome P450/NADPH--P450 reductase n=1 Tax=Brevundimonas sp. NIBR10 TaxID=3015997 RepID=UPI0022F1D056|nr:cytochrome P450 [Brevundimonas sp. NIBR10]WGM45961.1 Bifunctional cytochrome P450/NADPH--P450 reductase [Brevundimonas sp. NIBR10]
MSSQQNVPQPPVKLIVGNLAQIDARAPVQGFMELSRKYGPFFKMQIFDRTVYIASSQELVNELCDESRFNKRVHPPLEEIRAFAKDGLFTAYSEEPNWAKAHRILMPAFGPIGVRGMFDQMLDIADQMFVRWERFGPGTVIDVPDNMTRLTLDTIALCAFDYRFNSFYQDEMHPFVGAMVGALSESGQRSRRPKLVSNLMLSTARQYQADADLMHGVARQLIDERRRDPKGAEKKDLLNLMLDGVDPETGEKLSDENIGYQMITFLIAGHETTSGLLSFATYLLLKNPEALQKARAIVDDVLGDEMPRIEHLAQLRYIEQILMESLRLWPTAAVFGVKPLEDMILAGKYPLTTEDTVLILEPMLHRDPKVWEEPETFRPERFAPENAEKLPPNAWKPFGSGARACIGRPFAMQEAQLVLAMMLQRFDFVFDDPSYQLKVHETLTLKPENLKIRARARRSSATLARGGSITRELPVLTPPAAADKTLDADAPRLLVLYGSNTGSSEAFANRIAGEAAGHGFAATAAPMDDFAGNLPKNGALVVVTASYEGQPPDNARQFVANVEALNADDLSGVRFAVFGCGNRQWARTYQAIPKRVDAALEKAGGVRIAVRGEADSGGDFFGAFDEWYATFWPAASQAFGKEAVSLETASKLEVSFVRGGRESMLRLGDLKQGVVIENRELVDMSATDARSKRHIAFSLPEGMSYQAGDYLAVLARNPASLVDRVLRRFGLSHDTQIVISGASGATGLPTGHPVACGDLLESYVELAQPATRAQVATLAAATRCPPEKLPLDRLAQETYEDEVLGKRLSVIDLLDRFQACELDFAGYLSMLPPMKARQYSISSSPLWKPDAVTLTVAVVDAPALSGHGRYQGVASSYLASLEPGDRVSIAVRPSNARFHPPADPKTPMIMICAGSGIAPFRGFLQDRAAQKAGGQEIGPSLLLFGTNHPDVDYLYHDELSEWERDGVVEVLPAFSLQPEHDVKFVQHRVWAARERIAELFKSGATVFVCGDGRQMAPAVRETLIRIYRETTGATESEADHWADEIEREHGRYVADVFA